MPGFRDAFARAALRVRLALALRGVLDAMTVGTVLAAVAALGLARMGRPAWPAFALPIVAAVAASGAALRRRWSDADVALFLDARRNTGEAITTALGRRTSNDLYARTDAEVNAHVEHLAERALAAAPPKDITPRIGRRAHAGIALALVVVALAPRIVPVRPVPLAAPAPAASAARVQLAPKALTRVEELRALSAKTAAERARLEALAEQARKLEERAAHGLDRREALDALGKLREAIAAERIAHQTSSAGRREAARALARQAETRVAAEAVQALDLAALDREMERLARSLEARSRKLAMEGLDAAHEAAMARGDAALADALDEQRRLLKSRAARSEAFEKLSRLLEGALPEDARRKLERLDRRTAGSEALADALANALESLTPEERQKLARALAQGSAAMANEGALSQEETDRLAKALSSPEGREALRRTLEALARGEGSESAERERALAMAELAVGNASARAGGGDGSNAAGDGSPGATHGGGPGSHDGESREVAASSFAARARGRPTGGIPIGEVTGVAPASPAAAAGAARARAAALEAVAPREVGAVERSNVPREYREQVGRYFAP